jgi:hypothetical protein
MKLSWPLLESFRYLVIFENATLQCLTRDIVGKFGE